MIEAWIPITIAAAFVQNIRTALQKHLKDRLSTAGATHCRFLYGMPFAVIYVLGLHEFGDLDIPTANLPFYLYAVAGGLAQIIATAMLVALFSLRNFAVGTTYSKTETVQAALFGIIILGDVLGLYGVIAIAISFVGIMLLSMSGSDLKLNDFITGWTGKTALFGLISGGLFGVSAVSYRGAALSLEIDSAAMAAAFALVNVVIFQTVVMTIYILVREKGQMTKIIGNWRIAGWVGVTGTLGSIGWFTAMTLQNAAYVRAVGQVELIFTFLISYFFFKEKTNRNEAFGILLVLAGILILVLS
jgi:drug/metabolite transporter (DMT)-like permease